MTNAVDAPAASPRARQLRAHLLTTHRDAVEHQYSQLWGMRAAGAACGVLTLLLALLGIVACATRTYILASLVPGGKVLTPAAAVSLLLLAAAVVAVSLCRRVPMRMMRVCGVLVMLLALARLVEHMTASDWGVATLFLPRFLPPANLATGYEEFGATALLIGSLALLTFTWPRLRLISVILSIGIATVGAIVCLSYLFGKPLLYQTAEGPVSLPGALAMVLLGVGLSIIVGAWDTAAQMVTEAIVEDDRLELARLSASYERQRNELEALLSSAPNGIISFNREGRITRINPAAQEMLGEATLSTTEETVRSRPDIVDEQGKPVPLEATAPYRALQGEAVTGMVVSLLNATQGAIWVSASAVPLYDAAGNVDGALLVMTDITDLREAREQASRYAHELQTIMDYVPAGIILYDPEGGIRRLNEAARSALGMTDDMIGRPAAERFAVHDIVDEHGTPITPDTGVVAAVLSGQTVRNIVANFRNTPKGSVWLSVSGAPIPGPAGEIDGVVAAFSDVTALHDARQDSQQLAKELETVLSSIADGVVVYDAEGRVQRTNPAAEGLLQYTPELRAASWQERTSMVVPIGENGQPLTPEQFPLSLALAGERVTGSTMRFQRKLNGEDDFTPWLAVSAAPIYYDGTIGGAVLVLADISRLRQIELELRAYRDHLEKLVGERTSALEANQQRLRALAAQLVSAEQHERQRLASAIHDEVAQTLGMIKLRLQMLHGDARAGELADKLTELIEMTVDAIQQSRSIMSELSPQILQKEGLVPALKWWAEQVRQRHGLPVEIRATNLSGRLDSSLEIAVFQTARELLQNTIKHAQATSATISLSCSDGKLTFEVADNGIGFDASAGELAEKQGFGLFSVRERMAYLGGEFEIHSAPGRGTSSIITLPITCSAPA
jgi:PAS domain S-box-containing protein